MSNASSPSCHSSSVALSARLRSSFTLEWAALRLKVVDLSNTVPGLDDRLYQEAVNVHRDLDRVRVTTCAIFWKFWCCERTITPPPFFSRLLPLHGSVLTGCFSG